MSQSTPDTPESPTTKPTADCMSRRKFFERISIALGGASAVLLGVPVVGFLAAPLLEKAQIDWRSVGPVDSFQVGKTVKVDFEDSSPLPWSGVSAKSAAWLRRESATAFKAFAVNCTHLGCPVRWLESASLFMCPCHGGVYYANGTVAAGPPPHSLPTYDVRINNVTNCVEIRAGAVPISTD